MKIENEEQNEERNEESEICTQEIGSFEFLRDLVFGSGFRCFFFRLFWDLVFILDLVLGLDFHFVFLGFNFVFFLGFHFRLIFCSNS